MDVENKFGTLEIQKALLLLLKEFDSFCQRENVNYSISSGSLLGAVRHKGFIPWDDDLDCIMDRASFERFKELISRHPILYVESMTQACLWTERVRFRDYENKGAYTPSLDLFVIDNCPDNRFFSSIKMLVIKMLQGMMKYGLSLKNGSVVMKLFSIVTFILGRPFSHRTKYRWYNKVSQWGNKKPSRFYKIYNDQYKALKCLYPTEVMRGTTRFPFEDTFVNGFVHYDEYLRIIYGNDYMIPPEVSKRIPHHFYGE